MAVVTHIGVCDRQVDGIVTVEGAVVASYA